MAEEEKPTSHGINLADYVHKAQAEANENKLLDALEAVTKENDAFKAADKGREKHGDPAKLAGRIAELEGKVRGRAHRDAFADVAKALKIDPDFADDVFESIKFAQDKDEADPKAMKAATKEWLESKDSRKRYLAKEEEEEETPAAEDLDESDPFGGTKPAAKARLKLRTEDGEGEATKGRGTKQAGATKFRYRSSDLADVEWMGKNGVAYAAAVEAGNAVRLG